MFIFIKIFKSFLFETKPPSYDSLINYSNDIPNVVKKWWLKIEFKKKLTNKDYSKPTRVSNMYGGGKKPRKTKIKKQLQDNKKSFRAKRLK